MKIRTILQIVVHERKMRTVKPVALIHAIIHLMLAVPLAAEEVLTWDELEGLTPAEVGANVLQGLEHREIVEVIQRNGMLLPTGFEHLFLNEIPQRLGQDGCVREKWMASVLTDPPLSDEHRALVARRRSSWTEVALAPSGPCLFAKFARLYRQQPPELGIEGLRAFAAFRANDRAITCRDTSPTKLCEDSEKAGREVRSLDPWLVFRDEDAAFVLWLGRPGGLFTKIELPDDANAPARVFRRIPAPF